MGSVRLYAAIARMGFQRRLAYRAAAWAGLFTNAAFGYMRAAIFLGLFAAQTSVAGYTRDEMVTYSWLLQSIMMVIQLWGWFDVEETIRTGDVVSDLSKPFAYLGYWLAQDLGRAVFAALYRGVPIFLLGYFTMGIDLPSSPLTWPLFAASLVLGTTISFAWRFVLNLSAFWTMDARGVTNLGMGLVTAMSGFIVPLSFFPEPLSSLFGALPFAGLIQTPTDIFMERAGELGALALLARQALWAGVMLLLAQVVVLAATRRVVVQGG